MTKTFKEFLAETTRQNGKYYLPHNATRGDRGLWNMYNILTKEMAEGLDIAWRNVKFFGWSAEFGTIELTLVKKSADIEMLKIMAPKLLTHILEKTFANVEVLEPEVGKSPSGGTPVLVLKFKTKYPEEWIKYDREKYERHGLQL